MNKVMIMRNRLRIAATVAAVTIGILIVHQAMAQQSKVTTASPTVTAAGVTLHSVKFDLPTSDGTFPGGTDAEAINNNCLICHSARMILTQPKLSESVWRQEVEKMRGQFKAPIAAEDVPAIVAYLVSHKGS